MIIKHQRIVILRKRISNYRMDTREVILRHVHDAVQTEEAVVRNGKVFHIWRGKARISYRIAPVVGYSEVGHPRTWYRTKVSV